MSLLGVSNGGIVMWWLLVMLLMVDQWVVLKFLGGSMGGCVVDGWVEFQCWVSLGFGMSLCVRGFRSSQWWRERQKYILLCRYIILICCEK